MKCTKCKGDARVIDTVHNEKDNETYRWRKCTSCGHRYYTVEFEAIEDDEFKKDWRRNNRAYIRYRYHNK